MDELEWGAPPKREGRTYHRHGLIARRLRARRGEWAWVVYNSNRGAANAATKASLGEGPYEPAGDFEAVYREVEGEYRMYVRYLGDGPDE